MFKPLLLAAILAATVLPAAQQAHAEGISIDLMPGVSLRIGDRDNRGRYWDGYDWRDRDWWQRPSGALSRRPQPPRLLLGRLSLARPRLLAQTLLLS